MDNSEEQFRTLISHLILRVNAMLDEGNKVLPVSLVLNKNGAVDIFLVTVKSNLIDEHIRILQDELITKVQYGDIVASCIAYPDYDGNRVVGLLENNENYCAEVMIPVNIENEPFLDQDRIIVNEGNIYIFPIKTLSSKPRNQPA